MGFNITKEQGKKLGEFACSPRRYYVSPSLMREPKKNQTGGNVLDQDGHEIPDPKGKFVFDPSGNIQIGDDGYFVCEMLDNATGIPYISERGTDEQAAFEAAFAKIATTPKPLNKGQQAVAAAMNAQSDVIASKDAEIARLKAMLAGADAPKGDVLPVPPKKRRGAPPGGWPKKTKPEPVAPATT